MRLQLLPFLICQLLFSLNIAAQNSEIDSLKNIISTSKVDTVLFEVVLFSMQKRHTDMLRKQMIR